MDEKEKKELAISKIVIIVLSLAGIFFIVWVAWIRPSESPEVDSFHACREHGYPVQESYPETCVGPDGTRFTNPQQENKRD